MTYLDVWRSGTFPEKLQVSEYVRIANTDRRMTECLTSDSLGNVSWVLYSCTEGMCHSSTCLGMSLHVVSFTRPSPALVLQSTNDCVKRPGYEATKFIVIVMELTCFPFMDQIHVPQLDQEVHSHSNMCHVLSCDALGHSM